MPNIVNNTTFPSLLDLIAPHSCRGCGLIGEALCNRCKNYILHKHQPICPNCKAPSKDGKCPNCNDLPPIYIIGERSGLLGSIVHDYKYQSVRALARPLAEMLFEVLPNPKSTTYIVPAPTISKHIRKRGLDHTKLIAKELSKLDPKHYRIDPVLIRAKETVQVGASQSTRQIQAQNAYQLSPKAVIDTKSNYLLLDDVWTTGASVRACIKKLQQAGVQNLTVALLSLSRID